MANFNLGILCASLGALLLFASHLWTRRKHSKEAAIRGCGRLPAIPRNDPLGLIRFRELIRARREERVLPWMVEVMDLAGQNVHTAKDTILGHSFIWTRDIENSRAVLASQANDFEIAIARQESLLPVIGSGVFTRTGHEWRESRTFVRSQFAYNQVSKLDLVEKHFQAMLSVIRPSDDSWTPDFDIQPLLLNLTLDLFTELMFGTSANSQAASSSNESSHKLFQYHWDDAQTYFSMRALLGRFCWLYNPKRFQEHCSAIHAYADHYVSAAIERKQRHTKQGATDNEKGFVIIDELVEVTSDHNRLRDECLNILGAGRTSTAALISWVLYFLSRNSSIVKKLRKIILADFGTFEVPSEITYESLKRCQYLRHCINETFRISPVNPLTVRVATRDTTLPTGGGPEGNDPIFVPQGMEIQQAFYPMCMRTDIWGVDVATFRPERFENRKLSSEWMPFGSGPRICLGRKCLTEA